MGTSWYGPIHGYGPYFYKKDDFIGCCEMYGSLCPVFLLSPDAKIIAGDGKSEDTAYVLM